MLEITHSLDYGRVLQVSVDSRSKRYRRNSGIVK